MTSPAASAVVPSSAKTAFLTILRDGFRSTGTDAEAVFGGSVWAVSTVAALKISTTASISAWVTVWVAV